MKKLSVIGIVLLLIPLAVALDISNVQVEDITDVSAVITWQTDEAAQTFVDYGTDKSALVSRGDARVVFDHQYPLTGLTAQTEYFYKVRSGDVVDDNNGELYSFTTLAPDTDAPLINASLEAGYTEPSVVLSGVTESGLEVRLTLNGVFAGLAQSSEDGTFTFSLTLQEGLNTVSLLATDSAGNVGTVELTTTLDTKKPVLEIEEVPSLSSEGEINFIGTISELSTVVVSVNDREVSTTSVSEINVTITLEEGDNNVTIIATDSAGLSSDYSTSIFVDRTPPSLDITVEEGTNYYQGSAESTITGTTEPGADVYLYYFRPRAIKYTADFDRAHYHTTADEEGNFRIEDVNLERQPIQLRDLAPREVPQGLQGIEIQPVADFESQEQVQYKLYVIAEDQVGLVTSEEMVISVSKCFSSHFDFRINPIVEFQLPGRIDSDRLDSGIETITQIVNMSYSGLGSAVTDSDGRVITAGYDVSSVSFQKACTPGMEDDPSYKVSCKVMPDQPQRLTPNSRGGDKNAFFLEWRLKSTEALSETDPDFLEDLKQRQVMFPYKMTINYRDRNVDGSFGPQKTQLFCGEFGYFADIPIDSKNLVPDYLANEGVTALNTTVNAIEAVVPHIETALEVAAVGCGVSILGRTATRFYRQFMSKLEPWITRNKGDDEKCPGDQSGLYLKSNKARGGAPILDDKCGQTAAAWEIESYLDQAYRWTCNRVFCRSAPAKWTETKREPDIQANILQGQQCGGVVARGIPLQEIEDCSEKIADINTAAFGTKKELREKTAYCYLPQSSSYGDSYYVQASEQPDDPWVKAEGGRPKDRRFFLFKPLERVGPRAGSIPQTELLAYKPEDSDQFIVGENVQCKNKCKDAGKFKAASDNAVKGCRVEDKDGKVRLKNNEFSAGYTQDCFPTTSDLQMKQCICEAESEDAGPPAGVKNAVPEEEWSYRQERLYKESGNDEGTYYSPIRYYKGRDLSATFGLNHVFDMFRADGNEQIATIDPNSQHIGAFQSVCLSGIRGRLIMLQSILEGMQNCIIQAKKTGLQDVGMCKQIFSQYACGLVYKAVAYAAEGCYPIDFESAAKKTGTGGAFEGIEQGYTAARDALYGTMQSSIDDLRDDYGNAKLNQYFAGGVEGLTRSICLAAIGYDWPLGMDALMDAAYDIEMKTSVIPLGERELVSYNPAQQTAQFSYKTAATIFPGCQIRSYTTKLKCVGPEDVQRPNPEAVGIDCAPDSKGRSTCDCINVPVNQASGQREYMLQGGRDFDIGAGQVVDVPIQSPVIVDSPYRYDHMVVEIELDQFSSPENCFDEFHQDGKFYSKIVDVSPQPRVACEASLQTGQYRCTDVGGFFGATGAAYLEAPYLSCYNERESQWGRCNEPNTLLKGDTLRVKPHIFSDGKGQCVQMELRGANRPWKQEYKVPEGITTIAPEFTVTQIDDNLFGTASANVRLQNSRDAFCGQPSPRAQGTIKEGVYTLTFDKVGGGWKMDSPQSDLFWPDRYNPNRVYQTSDFADIEFTFGGFTVKGIGLKQDPTGKVHHPCSYVVSPAATPGFVTQTRGEKTLTMDVELRAPGPGGNCQSGTQPLQSRVGLTKHRQSILIQLEPSASQEVSEIESLFTAGKYDEVMLKAQDVLFYEDPTLADAEAFYYAINARVMKGIAEGDSRKYLNQIQNLQLQFFEREYGVNVLSTPHYQKIQEYIIKIDEWMS